MVVRSPCNICPFPRKIVALMLTPTPRVASSRSSVRCCVQTRACRTSFVKPDPSTTAAAAAAVAAAAETAAATAAAAAAAAAVVRSTQSTHPSVSKRRIHTSVTSYAHVGMTRVYCFVLYTPAAGPTASEIIHGIHLTGDHSK